MKVRVIPKGVTLKLQHSSEVSEIVVLYPVTKEANQSSWQRMVRLIKESEIDHFVLIDKTPKKDASAFFSRVFSKTRINFYILEHSLEEGIHESQGYVVLDERQWIIQFHDDDTWEGRISKFELITNKHKNAQVVTYKFVPLCKGKELRVGNRKNWPASIQFSLVSWIVWNTFVNFIREQNYKVAGSADCILFEIAESFGEPIQSETLKYFYNSDNWTIKRRSQKLLMQMAVNEGWGDLASINFSLVGRELDRIALRENSGIRKLELLRCETSSIEVIRKLVFRFRIKLYFRLVKNRWRKSSYQQDLDLISSLRRIRLANGNSDVSCLVSLISLIEKYVQPKMDARISYWRSALSSCR